MKQKIRLCFALASVILVIVGAFLLYRTGAADANAKCQAQIAQMSANMHKQSVQADEAARAATMTKTTAEKLEWLKQNRGAR